MNLRIITKSHAGAPAGDPEKAFLTKSISKPYSRATAMPPAWELKKYETPRTLRTLNAKNHF